MTFRIDQKVGEIVAEFPEAAQLFQRHGVDFCCGGSRPLKDALAQKGIAAEAFLAELQAAHAAAQARQERGTDWRTASYAEIIDQIVGVHHQYLKSELPVISGYVTKIYYVHGQNHAELAALHRQFHQLKLELEQHLHDEEARVFPLVLAYAQSGSRADLEAAVACLDELEQEHQGAGDLLLAMRETTGGYALPADACTTYALTFQKLQELEADMFQHVHLENNVLFPRLRAAR
ncbi:regulator of cell morphogenesis and NO signaling [Symbiobacterium terraclitae]|uniref:Regulator of cell morphogenesis and NO signaling n=1 Tax=Symbiobacterium terraclitae TaxID=557451 RepID=A0ABS4JWA1_9FIRM|nr:iron-sulfur cluster repair di-iron protein [Symbiobacterium terraclitae]MBP2019829.1 regulator of cell morphogenesis and NO signaling [Symbiobacterium terraclitae]